MYRRCKGAISAYSTYLVSVLDTHTPNQGIPSDHKQDESELKKTYIVPTHFLYCATAASAERLQKKALAVVHQLH